MLTIYCKIPGCDTAYDVAGLDRARTMADIHEAESGHRSWTTDADLVAAIAAPAGQLNDAVRVVLEFELTAELVAATLGSTGALAAALAALLAAWSRHKGAGGRDDP